VELALGQYSLMVSVYEFNYHSFIYTRICVLSLALKSARVFCVTTSEAHYLSLSPYINFTASLLIL
jgi:hypothetical protein